MVEELAQLEPVEQHQELDNMKKYFEFILEARGSRAAEKAANMGLISDKHGGWLDRSGRAVARTEKGDLVFLKKKSPTSQKDTVSAPESRLSVRQDLKLEKRPQPQRQILPPEEQKAAPKPDALNALTVVFGKFNPPTSGHEKLLKRAKQISAGSDFKIYPSRAFGDPSNPLDPKTKIFYMRKSFPDFDDNIINNDDMKTIFDVLKRASEDGYEMINLVTGSKRKAEFDRLSKQYNGELYNFEEIKVIPFDSEDPDLENSPNPTSSAKLRKAAAEDDFFSFQKGLSKKLDKKQQNNLFLAVQKGLAGEKSESWKIDSTANFNVLKEEYYKEQIFNKDDMIESLNTGLVGKIIRRGPNYVICVNEDLNIMFKSWITDIKEWTDVSGVSPEQREVGTDSFREYTMKMTGINAIKNFLAKRKQKTK